MFVMAVIEDLLKVLPEHFDRPTVDVLTDVVDMKYSNKVLFNVGLGICLSTFDHVGDSYIHPNDGSAHYQTKFKLLIFRPFVGEILVGKVTKCNKTGLMVSIGIFDDIIIPSHLLPFPSIFLQKQNAWQWQYSESGIGDSTKQVDSTDHTEDPDSSYIMQCRDEIRFRIRSLDFIEQASGQPVPSSTLKALNKDSVVGKRRRNSSVDLSNATQLQPCMKITASTNEDGLGLTSWW